MTVGVDTDLRPHDVDKGAGAQNSAGVATPVGAAEAASFCSLPCEGRGGLGRGVFRINANRGHPLPASPCRRRGRGHELAAAAAPAAHQGSVPPRQSRKLPLSYSARPSITEIGVASSREGGCPNV